MKYYIARRFPDGDYLAQIPGYIRGGGCYSTNNLKEAKHFKSKMQAEKVIGLYNIDLGKVIFDHSFEIIELYK